MNTYTNDQLNDINRLCNQINQLAEKQQENGIDDFGTMRGGDEPILLEFIEHTDPPYVVVYDGFAQSTVESINYPLTQLPEILKLVQVGTDILAAVSLVKVWEALELLQYHTDAGNLNDDEAGIKEQADSALRYLKLCLKGRIPTKAAAIGPTFGGFAEPVEKQ